MIPQNELNAFRTYLRDTPARAQSTQGWTRYLQAHGGPAGAYDAKPGRRLPTFRELYGCTIDGTGKLAYDAEFERRGGNVIGPSGRPTPECLPTDEDPPPQHEVESTSDAEPPDGHGPHGRAPPWGPNDLPTNRSVTEPNPNIATDPYTEQQRKAFGAAAGIDPDFARRALHEDAALETITHGQQGREVGPEDWERTRGRDQAEHEDREQDEQLIDEHLTKLLKAIARDRSRRRAAKDQGPPPFEGRPSGFTGVEGARLVGEGKRMAGDSRSFHATYPHTEQLLSGVPAVTPCRLPIDRRAR
jgi:hypothetical protein